MVFSRSEALNWHLMIFSRYEALKWYLMVFSNSEVLNWHMIVFSRYEALNWHLIIFSRYEALKWPEVGIAPKKSVPHRAPPHRKKPVPHRAPPHRRPVRKYFRTSAPAIFSENLFLWITTQPTGLEKCMTPQIDREFHEESNDAIDNTVSLMDDD